DQTDKPKKMYGVALKNKTTVYAKPSSGSEKLKSYKEGHVLIYNTFLPGWYKTGVFIDGEKVTGYINANDVEDQTDKPKKMYGVALKNKTTVYAKPSSGSEKLKSYKEGHVLIYNTFLPGWYKTGVFIDGEKVTGYINANDVEDQTDKPKKMYGVALKNKTTVYAKPSSGSEKLKSYKEGHVLIYNTFLPGWYKTGVFIDGEKVTGYINANDVEDQTDKPKKMYGVALKNKTTVYAKPSSGSEKLKSYKEGHVLIYNTFLPGWYKTGVFIDGEKVTGYINANDVEDQTDKPKKMYGVALKNKTTVYAKPSSGSEKLKSYKEGHVLIYNTFLPGWYKTGVFIDGEKVTGYINANDVEDQTDKPKKMYGVALKNKTTVYAKPSSGSEKLKSYKEGHVLIYNTYIPCWYKTGVFIDGEKVTGYINANDVEKQTDKPEKLNGVALKNKTTVYAKPSSSSEKLKSYKKGHVLIYNTFIPGWYKTGVFIDGEKVTGYINANEVETVDEKKIGR